MGKTSFALNLAYYAAEQGHHTAFFSLEMSSTEIFYRLLSGLARIDGHRLQAGYLSQTDYARMSDAIEQIARSYIHIDDSPAVSLMDVRGKSRRLKSKHGLGLVVLDYLQLMQLPRAENRNIAVGDVSRGLKLVARELDVPMVVLSQLSRDAEKRGGEKKPLLSDLRDSGALEQDADLVVFIHRPEVYDPTPENAGLGELIIAKQRNGPTGTVKLSWVRELTKFESWSGR
jgi:replicative DNA helicase